MAQNTAQQHGKLRNTIGYFGAIISFGAIGAAWGPALPSLAQQTQSDLGQISLIFPFNQLGFLLGSSLGGRIYDRIPGHPVMAGGLVVMMATIALLPSITQLWLLALVVFILGAALGLMVVGANTLTIWVHQASVGPWMNALTLSNGIGGLISPMIISSVLAVSGNIDGAFWLLGAYLLLPATWLLSSSSPLIPAGKGDGQNERINYHLVIPLALIFLINTGAEVSFHGWFYSMVVTIHTGLETIAGYMIAAFWGAITTGRLLSIFLITRFSPQRLLFASFMGGLVSAAITLAGPAFLPALWIGAIGMGLSLSSIFPILLTFSEKRMPISGKITGIFFSAGALGAMSLPWLSGQLFKLLGARSPMMVVLIAIMIAAGIFTHVVLTTRHKTERVEQPAR